MTRPTPFPATDDTGRAAAWREEVAAAIERGRVGLLAR